jgi:hypothetical protein
MYCSIESGRPDQPVWFVEQVENFHSENMPHPKRRFTRRRLFKNVHPNQEAFMTDEGAAVQEAEFAWYLSKLRKEKLIELNSRQGGTRGRLGNDSSVR